MMDTDSRQHCWIKNNQAENQRIQINQAQKQRIQIRMKQKSLHPLTSVATIIQTPPNRQIGAYRKKAEILQCKRKDISRVCA